MSVWTSLQKRCLSLYLRPSGDLCTASLQVSKQEDSFFLLCVYTNIYISHCCLFNKVSGSRPLLPSFFHFPELDAHRPKLCVLKDVSSLTCSWVLHRVPITWCHPRRRHTLLQQPCVNSLLLLKCLPGQGLPGVYTSSISTQIQVWCSL